MLNNHIKNVSFYQLKEKQKQKAVSRKQKTQRGKSVKCLPLRADSLLLKANSFYKQG
jgi:hypothetical protein